MDLAPGQKLGRFLLEKQLGKGAVGVVFLAQDTLLGQPVALKVLHAWLAEDNDVRERFKREIVLTRRVSHPGVCRLHDVHEDQGLTFIAMELVEGKTLAAVVQKEGMLTPAQVLDVLRGLAPPLQAAHDAGVIHRDLKPGNIMVRKDGSVSVLDFGMATANDVTKITQAGRTVGSLRFIAPEVWQGEKATAQSDIYALGVVLYACLAGKLPYDAQTPSEAFAAQKQAAPSLLEHNASVTPAIDDVVKKAMARKAADRYARVGDLLRAFERAVAAPGAVSATGTEIVRPRDAQDVSNIRLMRLRQATGEVFAPVGDGVPRPVLIGAAVVGVCVVGAVVAALLVAPAGAPSSAASAPAASALVSASSASTARDAVEAPDAAVVLSDGDLRGAADPAGAPPIGGDPSHQQQQQQRPRPPASASGSSALAAAAAATTGGEFRGSIGVAMKKKGLIRGDVPAIDALVTAKTAKSLERAKAMIEETAIDRGFIASKQKRLRFAAERASAPVQQKINALENEIESLVVARDYAGANERLNRGFALLQQTTSR